MLTAASHHASFRPVSTGIKNARRQSPIHAPPEHYVAEAVTHSHVNNHHDQIILATAIILV